jgi:hypothetical protein
MHEQPLLAVQRRLHRQASLAQRPPLGVIDVEALALDVEFAPLPLP